jgi:D-alanyl-D-alanine carboxypeptidase/D-alanyl-D-alanine-endopeptidase (penicillin-binding protein 4)
MFVAEGRAIKVLALRRSVGQAEGMRAFPRSWHWLLGMCVVGCQKPSAPTDAVGGASASVAPTSASSGPESAPLPSTPALGNPEQAEANEAEGDSEPHPAASAPGEAQAKPFDAARLEKKGRDFATWAKEKKGHVGAAFYDLLDGRWLFDADSKEAVNPASNQKVLTAAAVLHGLGPAYRFTTELRATGTGESVDAVVLRGDGDPSFDTPHLMQLARAARQLGLRRVGRIYVDQSHFDDQFVPPAFEQQPNEWASFRAPVSAVALDENAVTLNVLPSKSGEPAKFWIEPPGVVLSSGSIETRAKGAGDGVSWSLDASGPGKAERLASVVGGGIAEGLERHRYTRRLDDPRLAPGLALRELFRELGVAVDGDVLVGKTEAKTQLVYLRSEPLSQLLYQVGKYSDNFYAETLLKALAAKTSGKPGTTEAGTRAILAWLERSHIDTKGLVLKNGSGLFDANRVSPRVLAETLAASYREPAISSEMVAQLAVGGVDGTLHKRFSKLAARRAVRAKTGTLNNVVALSGYVFGPAGRPPVAFSIIAEGLSAAEARVRIDELVEEAARELWGS